MAKKKNDPSEALRQLLGAPGSADDIWDDLLGTVADDATPRLTRALAYKKYDARSAVLVFGSLLDRHLEMAISALLSANDPKRNAKLFGYDDRDGGGPLATFAAKIKMGYSMGLYEVQMLEDMELIKLIRNVFAHARVHIDFETPAVMRACASLTVISNLKAKGMQVGHRNKSWDPQFWTARQQYTGAIAVITNFLGLFPQLPMADAAILQNYAAMYRTTLPLPRRF